MPPTPSTVLWFSSRPGLAIRDALAARDVEVSWTETCDDLVADAIIGQGLCHIAVLDGALAGARKLARAVGGEVLILWLGPHAVQTAWIELPDATCTQAIATAIRSASRFLGLRALTQPAVAAPPTAPVQPSERRIAQSADNVLILGGSPTTRQAAAARMHATSQSVGPPVHVRCNLDDDLVHDELFGENGAAGRTGTVVLHDVDRLGPRSQAALCTWLRSEDSDVRVVSTCSREPSRMLREDLHFRLAVLVLRLPASTESHLHLAPRQPARAPAVPARLPGLGPAPSSSHDRTLAELERQTITSALKRLDGNVSEVGRELGISRSTLYRKLRKYGLR